MMPIGTPALSRSWRAKACATAEKLPTTSGDDAIHSGGGTDALYGDAGDDSGHFALSNPTYYSESFDGGDGIDRLVMDWSSATTRNGAGFTITVPPT